ncbi:CDP-diacylglycerol--serine O-phosphatidyltransferase [Thauera butanivorans]|jgi:CDP-diacylglycerol--serine O-phosphatidyltransferase|uniref:CDP-diacylglycerol--serine O-phosphatidyltransferase n=1 Tax=Thauera butanivorans TaxID=86174 RepID=UPI00083982ED|nr:CDP-diacylglycerol--serine O-phosphatidyltransferase [Thauera butanivorans]
MDDPDRMPLITPDKRRRGIYILPNLFTTAALFAGFYAIVQAMDQRFEIAAVAIFVAMVLDGLDGRIARLTHTQSEFGAEYDSLADMVSFGAAPALVMYEWALRDLGKLGWIAAFIYCAGAALRLARFNTNISVVDKRYFQGLPSPAAAALTAGLVWVGIDNGFTGDELSGYACVLTIFAGVSMVSNVLFWSGKSINLRKSVPFIVLIAFVLVFALISSYPPGILFGLFLAYAASGYVMWVLRWKRRKDKRASAMAPAAPAPQADGTEPPAAADDDASPRS